MGACRAIRCGGPVSTISPGSVSDQNSTHASCHGVSMEDAVVDRGCGNDSTRVRCMGPDTAWHLPCSVFSLSQVDLEVYSLKHDQMPLREQGIWLAYIQTVLHWVTCLWTGTRWLKVSHDDHSGFSGFCLETAVIEAGVASVRHLASICASYTVSFSEWTARRGWQPYKNPRKPRCFNIRSNSGYSSLSLSATWQFTNHSLISTFLC